MMKVELLKTVKVVPKGSKSPAEFCQAGEVIDLTDADAKRFIKDGHAVDPSKKVTASKNFIDEEVKAEIEALKTEIEALKGGHSEKDAEIEALKTEIEALKGVKK